MLPPSGMPLRQWRVRAADLHCMHSGKNTDNVTMLVAAWIGLLQDSPVDADKSYRQGSRFATRLISDLRGLTKEYAELGDKLIRSLFHSDVGTRVKPMFREFSKTPIFREYHFWRRTGHPDVFQYILSFLWFGKKAEYFDETLQKEALAKWIAVEEDLHSLTLPQHVVQDLRAVLRAQGLLLDPNLMLFKHGPGAVSERDIVRTTDKNRLMSYHPQLSVLVDDLPPSPYRDIVLPDEFRWDSVKYGIGGKQSSAVSRLQFVPKDYKSVRTICMEPMSFMWAQQALMNGLVKAIEKSKLSKLIDINSQEKNRSAARYASEDGLFATLDNQAASDRVSVKLIRGIFEGKLLEYLLATRTSLVQLPDEDETVLEVEKFAPMGSAVCFPIQSIVFSLVCILVNHLHVRGISITDYLTGTRSVVTGWVEAPVEGTCVYGDDIILPDSQAEDMMLLLHALGFKVNTTKSFFGSLAFRESCGFYGYDGYDVTPIKVSTTGVADNTPESILGRIQLCNSLFARGWMRARAAVMATLDPKNFVVTDPRSCYSQQASAVHGFSGNPGRKFRFNKELFRDELKVFRPYYQEDDFEKSSDLTARRGSRYEYKRKRDTRNNADSRYQLAQWLGKPFSIEGGSHTNPDSDTRSLKWGWHWTPVS